MHVVTCTLGEDGEVIGDPYAQPLSTPQTRAVTYLTSELTAALDALGIGAPMFLGDPGRWRDFAM